MIRRPVNSWIGRVVLAAFAAVVSIPSAQAQGRPIAVVEQILGQVSVLRDGHPDIPLDLQTHKQVFAQQTVVTGPNSFAKFRLEDNSTFEVYENSTVVFKEDWPAWGHLLDVLMGRVKVFIDHSKGPNNNSVTTPTAVISVRGTVFDVVVDDPDSTLISCDDGLVQVRNLTAPGAEPLLHPGQSIRIFRGQGLVGNKINNNIGVQRGLAAVRDALYVLLQRQVSAPGGPGIGGIGGGTGGAQGDKGKGGATPPPAPTSGGH
jgi:ferric-dicitrate binding protein FerR (iron transport regulator)